MHRVNANYDRIIDALAGYTHVANPDEISRGKRRYHLTKDNVRRVMFIMDGDFLLKLKGRNKVLNILSSPSVVGVTPAFDESPVYLERIDYGKINYIEYSHLSKSSISRVLKDLKEKGELELINGKFI